MDGSMSGAYQPAKKFTRFASAYADLFAAPVILGVLVGILMQYVPNIVRNIIFVLFNVGWLTFRDAVFSPGRTPLGRKILLISAVVLCLLMLLASQQIGLPILARVITGFICIMTIAIFIFDLKGGNLKLINNRGEKPTILQALIRNLLLVVPVVLFSGYVCDTIRIFVSNPVVRKIFYGVTILVVVLFGLPFAIASKNLWALAGVAGAALLPLFYIIKDAPYQGDRILDRWTQTSVVQA